MVDCEQHSIFVLKASDEVRDVNCEHCHQAGHVIIAEGYCVDCLEYLCGPCSKSHRHKALSFHALIDKGSMQITTDSSKRETDVCEHGEDKCPIHPNKVIELFCETCDKLACTICLATDHCQCEKVKHIPDIAEDLEHTEELQTINKIIQIKASALSGYEKKLQAKVTFNSEMETLAKQELKRLRAEVNTYFDQLEKNTDDKITAIKQRNQATLKAASDRLDHMKTDFFQIKNDIETRNAEQRCELFIAMKRSKEKMKIFRDQYGKLEGELTIDHYTLFPSEQIQAMVRTTTDFFKIAIARFQSNIDVNTSANEKTYIDSLAVIHGHYCVALDSDSKSMQMIDTNSKYMTSEITIGAEDILSMTSVNNDQVAVSVTLLDGRNQIQFFNVTASGVIQRTNKYDVDGVFWAMVYCTGNIYGVYLDRIDKLSMTGDIIKTIYTDDSNDLRSIAASSDGQTLYLTNSIKHSVTSMSLDGIIKAVFNDRDLKRPVGITVDKHDYVYVCSTGNIQQFTADLKKVQVLIDVDGGSITYSSTENTFYISVINQIRLYSLDFLQSNNHNGEIVY